MGRTTITTSSGKTVTGQEVRTEPGVGARDLLLGILTFGLADETPRVTVQDDKGNYWTGTPKR